MCEICEDDCRYCPTELKLQAVTDTVHSRIAESKLAAVQRVTPHEGVRGFSHTHTHTHITCTCVCERSGGNNLSANVWPSFFLEKGASSHLGKK